MNILYIHGLDSSPNQDRISWLQSHGHQVLALHLDYRKQPDAYSILSHEIREHGISYLVGSSLGGRLGYWLAESFGIPCLLFNPALEMAIPELLIPNLSSLRCPERYIVLGAKDDRVDPEASWDWLKEHERPGLKQYVAMYQWLGHQIDPHTFACAARWAGL